MAKRLNECSQDVINENFLEENPSIPLEQVVITATEVPPMDTIIFFNNRDPGMPLEFHYHSKTHRLKQYVLIHGQKYSLPVEIIKHLEGMNEADPYSCHSKIYSKRVKSDGMTENYVSGHVGYFQCKPTRA
jgi:hypothetical protein